jgi:HSP20 family protein
MKTDLTYEVTNCIYPGTYVPFLGENEVSDLLKKSRRKSFRDVNISETGDSYKIDVTVPGLKREELFLHAHANMLWVRSVHKRSALDADKKEIEETNYVCTDGHIRLPANADTQFASAEYNGDLLSVYVSKAKKPARNSHSVIIPY